MTSGEDVLKGYIDRETYESMSDEMKDVYWAIQENEHNSILILNKANIDPSDIDFRLLPKRLLHFLDICVINGKIIKKR